MTGRRRISRILFIIITSLLIFLVFIFCGYLFLHFSPSTEQKKEKVLRSIVEQQQLERNQYPPTTSSSFIMNEQENYHFGDTEYICTGTCSCVNRRNSAIASTISKSMIFLVAVSSSIIIGGKSKKYFQEECVKKLSETCNEEETNSKIISQLEECIEQVKENSKKKDDLEHYVCDGKCELNGAMDSRLEFKLLKIASEDGIEDYCKGLEHTTKMTISSSLKKTEDNILNVKNERQKKSFIEKQFTRDVMKPFCLDLSGENMIFHTAWPGVSEEEVEKRKMFEGKKLCMVDRESINCQKTTLFDNE